MDMANPYVPCVLFSDWRSQQEGGIYTNADVGPACACACASERPSTVPCVLYMHFWNSLSLSLPDFVLLLVYFNYSQGTEEVGEESRVYINRPFSRVHGRFATLFHYREVEATYIR